jgi:hypothetical protein
MAHQRKLLVVGKVERHNRGIWGGDGPMTNQTGAEFRPWYRTATGWLSVASLIVALGAAAFTGLQWHDAHNQLLLSMKPSVNFDTEDDPDAPPVGIEIRNAGPGPAVIKSLTYYVDRKSVKDWTEAEDYGKLNPVQIKTFEFALDDTLTVNENEWLVKHSKYHGKEDKPEVDKFTDFIDQQVGVEVVYCSLAGECWKKCSTKDRCH